MSNSFPYFIPLTFNPSKYIYIYFMYVWNMYVFHYLYKKLMCYLIQNIIVETSLL